MLMESINVHNHLSQRGVLSFPLPRPLSLPLAGLQPRCEGSRPDESPLCPVKIPIFVKGANCQERGVGVGWWGGGVSINARN